MSEPRPADPRAPSAPPLSSPARPPASPPPAPPPPSRPPDSADTDSASDDDHPGVPGFRTWRGVYVFVFAVFVAVVLALTWFARAFA